MTDRANVPCGSCNLCCHRDMILLFPEEGDDVASYEHEVIAIPGIGTGAILKKNGRDCVYLKDGRCSIWARAPKICRMFDCRLWFHSKTRNERRQLVRSGKADKEIFEAGRQRLGTL
jgi:Fe-S-cluster containining protein